MTRGIIVLQELERECSIQLVLIDWKIGQSSKFVTGQACMKCTNSLVPSLYSPGFFSHCAKKSWGVETGNEASAQTDTLSLIPHQ